MKKYNLNFLYPVILFLLSFGLTVFILNYYYEFTANPDISKSVNLSDIQFIDLQNKNVNLNLEKNNTVNFLFLGYIHCEYICPISLKNIQYAIEELSAEQRKKINAYFISIDSKRDTSEKLKKFMINFNNQIHALRVDEKNMIKLQKILHAESEIYSSSQGYDIKHNNVIYLFNNQFEIIVRLPGNISVKAISYEVKKVL